MILSANTGLALGGNDNGFPKNGGGLLKGNGALPNNGGGLGAQNTYPPWIEEAIDSLSVQPAISSNDDREAPQPMEIQSQSAPSSPVDSGFVFQQRD